MKAKSASALRRDRYSQKLKLCMCIVGPLAEGSLDLDNEDSLSESDRRKLIDIAEAFTSSVLDVFFGGSQSAVEKTHGVPRD